MSAPAKLDRVLQITRGADLSYKFTFQNDANGTPLPLAGSTASFDLIPDGPAQPLAATPFPLSSGAGYLVYSSTDNSWTVTITGAVTATIPPGSYRAWLYLQLTNGAKLIPLMAEVRVLPSGVAP